MRDRLEESGGDRSLDTNPALARAIGKSPDSVNAVLARQVVAVVTVVLARGGAKVGLLPLAGRRGCWSSALERRYSK